MAPPEVGPLEWGVAWRALPGEAISGDQSLIRILPDGVLVAVVDALGHGRDAAAAASKAIAVLQRFAHEPLPSLVQRCHAELVGTRGVVMSLACFRTDESSMTWLGVGNVEGMVISAESRAQPRSTTLLARPGIVGADLSPKVNPWVVPLVRGDTLVFATDGVRPGFAAGLALNETPQNLADRILASHAKQTDDALVLVVRFLGDQ
jgi:serine phosphatase RsbU (regulator of sigma subunit)